MFRTVLVILSLATAAFADDSAYWRARVSASIHLQAEQNPWYPPVPPTKPEAPAAKPGPRRHLLFFTQRGCQPCNQNETVEFPKLKAEGLTAADFGTVCHISRVDIHALPALAAKYQIDTTPSFVLLDGDKLVGTKEGYQSASVLSDWWFGRKPKAVAANRYWTVQELRDFARTYSGPMTGMKGKHDDYRSHLLDHGYSQSQVQGLSQSEAARVHGATHAGFVSPTRAVQVTKTPNPLDGLSTELRAMYQRAKAAGYSDSQITDYATKHGLLK